MQYKTKWLLLCSVPHALQNGSLAEPSTYIKLQLSGTENTMDTQTTGHSVALLH